MIGLGAGARVMIATRPVDFRKGPDALAALVGAAYGGDPFSGVIYVFRAKRADRIKLVWWDGTGLCLMAKKLESGGFKWPGIQDGVMRVTSAQLERFWKVWTGAGCMVDDRRLRRKLLVDGALSA